MTASTTAATSGSVTAQVMLCWAEYYNGKWQPTKTSDVSLPTTIGAFDQAGDGSFEAVRNQLRIVPGQFTVTNPDLAGNTVARAGIPPDALDPRGHRAGRVRAVECGLHPAQHERGGPLR